MGNFRSNDRDRGFSNNRSRGNSGGFSRGSSGGRSGGRSGFGGRDSGSFERGRPEMHEVTCDKCKKQCEVPFKPSGDKPVFCSDCFRKDGGSSFSPSSRDNSSSGISQEQYKEINTKLNKILGILESLEFEDEEGEDNSEDDEDSEEEDDEEPEVPQKPTKKTKK